MDDLDAGVVGVHTSEPQVHDDLRRTASQVLQQVGRLLELRGEDVAVVRIAREAPGAHHQPRLVRDRQADLDAEFVGLACLALADALDFRRVQRVELVLVVALLRADALGAFEPRPQIAERFGV